MHDTRPPRGRSALVRWGAVVVWAGVIFGASSLPGSRVPGRFGPLAHFIEYAILATLLYAALRLTRNAGPSSALALFIASAYAVTDELHQLFVTGRVADPADWLIDTAGAATAVLLLYALGHCRAPDDQ